MVTRGSKYFLGAAAVAYLTALVYGFITAASAAGGIGSVASEGGIVDALVGPVSFGWKGGVGDHVGYSILMGFAGAMAVLGGFTSAFRDGSPEALAQLQGATVEDGRMTSGTAQLTVAAPAGLNFWPIVGAFSVGAALIGLAVSSTLFVIGCVGLVVVTAEWTVRAWADQASGDPEANAVVRNRLMHPIEIPVGATIAIGLLIFLMSRILLAVSKLGAVFVIIVLAAVVFGVAILLANRPQLKRSAMVAALLALGVLLLAGGIAGGVAGQREAEQHGDEHSLAVTSTDPSGSIGTGGPGAGGH